MVKNTSQIADNADPANESGIWIYDIETYPNHFLAVFKRLQEDKQGDVKIYNDNELDELREFVSKDGLTLVGYNNFKFDDVIIKSILDGKVNNASEIHHLADHIINGDESNDSNLRALTYNGRKHWNYRTSPWHCVDLFQVLGGQRIAGSLKSHEVRLGMLDVRDLPFEPGTKLTPTQIKELLAYCQHDVKATESLFYDVQELVEVRIKVNDRFPYLNGVVDGVKPRLYAAAMKCRNGTAASLRNVLLKFLDAKTGYRHQSQVRTG